jgi:hypothetical protein
VRVDHLGRPVAVVWKGRRVAVQEIQDVWRIDDEWWRQEISRLYFQLALADGRLWTVFRDLLAAEPRARWFLQTAAAAPEDAPVVRVLVPPRVAPAQENADETAAKGKHASA